MMTDDPAADLEKLLGEIGDIPISFWFCPVEGHSEGAWSSKLVQTVEWVDGVATCLYRGCWRRSDDPVPRGECLCDGSKPDGDDCWGECCGTGNCSCTPSSDGGSA